MQWQCVVERRSTLVELCRRFESLPAFFSVLKRFGRANEAPLSFPSPGWTLAVDLPATTQVLDTLPTLDEIVASTGGRIYLAKDARLDRASFERMYPRLDEWRSVRERFDPNRRWSSDLAKRLGL